MTAARKRILSGVIALVVVALVGIGAFALTRGSGAAAGSSTPAQSGQTPRGGSTAALQQFRACMQTNGAAAPSPGSRPDRSDPAFAQALQACRQYLPQRAPGSGGFGPPGAGQSQAPPQQTAPSSGV